MNSTTTRTLQGTQVTSTLSTGSQSPLAGNMHGRAAPVLSPSVQNVPRGVTDRISAQGTREASSERGSHRGSPPMNDETTTSADSNQRNTSAEPSHSTPAPGRANTSQCTEPQTQHRNPVQNTYHMNNLPRILRPQKKKTRGTLKIATLNIRGAGSPTTAHKWRELNHRIKTESLSIVALQETHSLSDEKLDELNNKHGYRMHILHSGDPDHPQARGIAVVLNKYTTRWQEAKAKVVIPGRAMRVELPWNEERKLNILAIYAPNTTAENTAFWKELNHKWIEGNIPKPDIMLGDFNIVEESIDREPKRHDPRGATEALDELKSTLKLVDAWRLDHPKTEAFTWEQTPTRESKSRIDRCWTYCVCP
jgi:exonuclease III